MNDHDSRARTAFVLAEVAQERDRQDAKWGGPTHDDMHSPGDFCRFIREHEVRAEQTLAGEPVREFDEFRTQMLRVAALAVAALESWDRHWVPALDGAEVEDAIERHSTPPRFGEAGARR